MVILHTILLKVVLWSDLLKKVMEIITKLLKDKSSKGKLFVLIVILIIIFPVIFRLIRPGFYSMYDDMQVIRLQQMDVCVRDGQIPCRWVPDLGLGYGYPLYQYYAPLPYYFMETVHLLGFSYAPRIKNLKKQNLYIFKARKNTDQSDWKITPDKYINEKIIIDNWGDILRLITTIKLKETTASDIFRRLNSYSRQHPLYQALKAFGQIIKSLFILRYLDELELRQAIEKQLNKVRDLDSVSN